MTPWRCSTAVSPAWGPAWLHHPLLLPPLPIAIPTATPSPRASTGIPGVLRLLHHTQQLQQGTPPGRDISDSPLPPLHQGRGTQTIRMICFSRFPSAATRLEHHTPVAGCTHLSRRDVPRPGWGRWQEGSAGSSWALPSGDSPAGATRWPQSPGLRRAPCPAPPARLLRDSGSAFPLPFLPSRGDLFPLQTRPSNCNKMPRFKRKNNQSPSLDGAGRAWTQWFSPRIHTGFSCLFNQFQNQATGNPRKKEEIFSRESRKDV